MQTCFAYGTYGSETYGVAQCKDGRGPVCGVKEQFRLDVAVLHSKFVPDNPYLIFNFGFLHRCLVPVDSAAVRGGFEIALYARDFPVPVAKKYPCAVEAALVVVRRHVWQDRFLIVAVNEDDRCNPMVYVFKVACVRTAWYDNHPVHFA